MVLGTLAVVGLSLALGGAALAWLVGPKPPSIFDTFANLWTAHFAFTPRTTTPAPLGALILVVMLTLLFALFMLYAAWNICQGTTGGVEEGLEALRSKLEKLLTSAHTSLGEAFVKQKMAEIRRKGDLLQLAGATIAQMTRIGVANLSLEANRDLLALVDAENVIRQAAEVSRIVPVGVMQNQAKSMAQLVGAALGPGAAITYVITSLVRAEEIRVQQTLLFGALVFTIAMLMWSFGWCLCLGPAIRGLPQHRREAWNMFTCQMLLMIGLMLLFVIGGLFRNTYLYSPLINPWEAKDFYWDQPIVEVPIAYPVHTTCCEIIEARRTPLRLDTRLTCDQAAFALMMTERILVPAARYCIAMETQFNNCSTSTASLEEIMLHGENVALFRKQLDTIYTEVGRRGDSALWVHYTNRVQKLLSVYWGVTCDAPLSPARRRHFLGASNSIGLTKGRDAIRGLLAEYYTNSFANLTCGTNNAAVIIPKGAKAGPFEEQLSYDRFGRSGRGADFISLFVPTNSTYLRDVFVLIQHFLFDTAVEREQTCGAFRCFPQPVLMPDLRVLRDVSSCAAVASHELNLFPKNRFIFQSQIPDGNDDWTTKVTVISDLNYAFADFLQGGDPSFLPFPVDSDEVKHAGFTILTPDMLRQRTEVCGSQLTLRFAIGELVKRFALGGGKEYAWPNICESKNGVLTGDTTRPACAESSTTVSCPMISARDVDAATTKRSAERLCARSREFIALMYATAVVVLIIVPTTYVIYTWFCFVQTKEPFPTGEGARRGRMRYVLITIALIAVFVILIALHGQFYGVIADAAPTSAPVILKRSLGVPIPDARTFADCVFAMKDNATLRHTTEESMRTTSLGILILYFVTFGLVVYSAFLSVRGEDARQ